MFTINLHGKESIYEQIRAQILRFIQIGILKPNDKLPSVRELSMDLGINPNTVQKAYQRLEEDGYIYILSKKGAFISETKEGSEHLILDILYKDVKGYKDKGIKFTDFIKVIEEIYREEYDVRSQKDK